MAQPFYTIGHSTRPLDTFTKLLLEVGVELVIDIRTVPRSRTNPQYNHDTLPQSLAPAGIAYAHMAELGGLRGRSKIVPPETNAFWTNASFHNYADYALTDPFRHGLAELIALGRERPLAMMCSEAVWWRCHRRIVADYLVARDEVVYHIMAEGRRELARLTPGAAVDAEARVIYPAIANG